MTSPSRRIQRAAAARTAPPQPSSEPAPLVAPVRADLPEWVLAWVGQRELEHAAQVATMRAELAELGRLLASARAAADAE